MTAAEPSTTDTSTGTHEAATTPPGAPFASDGPGLLPVGGLTPLGQAHAGTCTDGICLPPAQG